MIRLPFRRTPSRPAASAAPPLGVDLADGLRGGGFLHAALRACAPSLAEVTIPADPRAFREAMPEALARFELARQLRPDRVELAGRLAAWSRDQLVFRPEVGGGAPEPLGAFLARADGPGALRQVTDGRGGPSGQAGPVPSGRDDEDWRAIPWGDTVLRGGAAERLVDELLEAHHLEEAARAGLRGVLQDAPKLAGERFAVLGAAAELAPTALLLAAGADVLWIDRAPPEAWLAEAGQSSGSAPGSSGQSFPGRLFAPAEASCLLARPHHVRAAVEAFAEGRAAGLEGARAVHVGAFAYAPGRGRELRLAGAMEAVVHTLDAKHLASFSTYVSPTTPSPVSPRDRREAERRRAAQPAWQRALSAVGLLRGEAWVSDGDLAISTALVPLQGPSYQAAQYLAKMMAAEHLASRRTSLRVSANVAGITATRSLGHPLFQAAFAGAVHFGVRVFPPDASRALSGLLMLGDLFGPGRAATLSGLSTPAPSAPSQIHGGVRALPFRVVDAIRVGAVVGLAREPGHLLALARMLARGRKVRR